MQINDQEFIKTVWNYYHDHKRPFIWRENPTSYNVLVSEFMLQQTQTSRVVPKFNEFMTVFPTLDNLANGSWKQVLKLWVGLGYNRRARNLHLAAQTVQKDFNSTIPSDKTELMSLPGIGDYTSSAIRAFAFNLADAFIETNIRTVYLHHYFADQIDIADSLLMPLITQTLDHNNPREWYWALMDYGVYIKSTYGNANLRSKHHTKQSKFEGSTRQLRSQILKSVLLNQGLDDKELRDAFAYDNRADKLIDTLVKEGLIRYNGKEYSI